MSYSYSLGLLSDVTVTVHGPTTLILKVIAAFLHLKGKKECLKETSRRAVELFHRFDGFSLKCDFNPFNAHLSLMDGDSSRRSKETDTSELVVSHRSSHSAVFGALHRKACGTRRDSTGKRPSKANNNTT